MRPVPAALLRGRIAGRHAGDEDEYRYEGSVVHGDSSSGKEPAAQNTREFHRLARAVPGVFELPDGGVSVSRLRTVDIADLLRRTQVVADPGTASYREGQVVLVAGAGGSIRSELCRQVALSRGATPSLVPPRKVV